jgi:sugar transferase (PEP-CTERM/EpsH1 system associated)
MRILWLNSGLLLPLDKGGKLRSWHLLRHLAARHAVTYLSFTEPSNTPRDIQGMLEACDDVQTVARRDVAKGTARFYLDAARHLANRLPYAVAKYRSAEYRARLATLLDAPRWDVVLCDFLVPAVNMPARVACPTVLFTHNVEAEIWRRHAETAAQPVRRALLRGQWRRMLRFEGATLKRFDQVLAVSEADRDTFSRLYGPACSRAPMHVVPTGVDTEYFAPRAAETPDPFRLVFTGSMDWLPNEDAVLHFCREVLPLLRRAEPRISLSIVGRHPTAAVRRLQDDPAIQVTGRVDDVRPHVATGVLSIVPLRIGGGTRLKIYESMAMGRAVVSTTVGAEGLPLTPGVHIALADAPESFAGEVLRLLRDEAARRAMEEAGRALVLERYDWGAVAGVMERAMQTAISMRASRRRERGAAAPAVPAVAPLASSETTTGHPAQRRVPS